MYLEAESSIDPDTVEQELAYIAPAYIENINESGDLLIRFESTDRAFWTEPYSKFIHPCGYWKQFKDNKNTADADSFQLHEFLIEPGLDNFIKDYDFCWYSFFKHNAMARAAPLDLFNVEQKNIMSFERTNEPEYFVPHPEFLSCNFKYNPRYAWSSLKSLVADDISEIYREIGIIKVRSENKLEKKSTKKSASLVLLPKTIQKSFLTYPNISSVGDMTHLHVTCTHREDVKLYIGYKNMITNRFPHLLEGDAYDLVSNNTKLDMIRLIVIMCTSLDISNSMVNM